MTRAASLRVLLVASFVLLLGTVDHPTAVGQLPYIVKDINTGGSASAFNVGVAVGNVFYFDANDVTHGRELWRSDGTAAGTWLVKDIRPGSASGFSSQSFVNMNGTLFFQAVDGTTGQELWKSDGTAAGTVLVKDINPGANGSVPSRFTVVNNTLFFSAFDPVNGTELWMSDGTEAGTVLVKNINPAAASSSPGLLVDVNGTLFFTATDGSSGIELWKSDGTAAGTVMVKDIIAGSTSSAVQLLTNVNGTLFFAANNGTTGTELWKSDGTVAGTVLVKDIFAGTTSSNIQALVPHNGAVYFAATDAANGGELWKSDGTLAGTVLVKDINPGGGGSTPTSLTSVGTKLFFAATDVNGTELWSTDGTTAGTAMVKDIWLGLDSQPTSFVNVNGTLFFQATDLNGAELWKSNGTAAGTMLVKDIEPGAFHSTLAVMTNVNGVLFFRAQSRPYGQELWTSNGTAAGTQLVEDINPTNDASNPANFATMNGKLYFSAFDWTYGVELWVTDGTESGTAVVKDIRPGLNDSSPSDLAVVNGVLYFVALSPTDGRELWRSDGTEAGTVMVKDILPGTSGSNPSLLTNVNGTLFFRAFDNTNGQELWKSDGTAAGTVLVKDIVPGSSSSSLSQLVAGNGRLFFTATTAAAGTELWTSDGTTGGTVMVKDVLSGPSSGNANSLVTMGGIAYFAANDGANGIELWRSDGTAAGTTMVKDIVTGAGASSGPQNIAAVNGTLYFSAINTGAGSELWKSDGTALGTVFVKDLNSGSGGSFPMSFTAVGGTVFFTASTPAESRELWRTDGTSAGTVFVKDVLPGTASSGASLFTNVNGTLYFVAQGSVEGIELWRSDGTDTGTTVVADIVPGTGSSNPNWLTNLDGRLLFSATDPVYGNELWALNGAPLPQTISVTTPAPASAAYDTTFNVAATASSGLDVVITAEPSNVCAVIAGGTAGTATIRMESGTGVCTVHYNQPGDATYDAAPEVTSTTTASKVNPSVTFTGAPATAAFGDIFAVASSTESTAVPVYTSSGACSNTGASYTMTSGAGVCTATATWAADSNYNGAMLTQDTVAGLASQTINFAPLGNLTYGAAPFALLATGGASGNPVVFTSTTPGVCATTGTNGALATIVGAGACSITATQAGNDDYAAAGTVTRGFTVDKAQSTTVVTGGSFVYNGSPRTATAVVSGVGSGITQTVSWSYSGSCSAAPATVPEGTSCVARADYGGDANHEPSFGVAGIAITPAASTTTVTFEAGPYTFRGASFTATATATGANLSQGVAVTYSGDCLNVTNPNGCTAAATFAGDDNHTGSTGSASVTIVPAVANVTITPYSGQYDGNAHGLSGAATGVNSADLSGSLDLGDTFTNVPGGTATWTLNAGANYTTQTGTAAVTITPAGSTTTVTFEAGPYTFRGTPFTATASVAGINLSQPVAVTYSGDCLNVTSVNGCTATATFAGDGNHTGGTGSASITLAKAVALVNITPYSGGYDGNAHGLSGSATGVNGADVSAGLDLGATFTNTPGGTATWTFNGGANYGNQTGTAAVSITPAGSTTTVTFEAGPYTYRGTPFTATASVAGTNLSEPVAVTYSGDCLNVTSVNGCTATATFAGDGNHTGSTGSASVTLGQAMALVSIVPYSGGYDGSAHGLSGSATGVNSANLNAGLDLGATFTDAPGGTATWTFNGGTNYSNQTGSAAVTITAAGSTTTVTFEPGPYTFRGTPFTATASVAGTNLSQPVAVSYSGDCLNVTSVNGCTATATFAGDGNHTGSTGSASITLGQAVALVTITPYSGAFDGNAHGLQGTATGVGGANLTAGLDLGGTFTDAPGGTATWTFTGGANYTNQTGTAPVTITPAGTTTTVTFEPGPYLYRGSPFTATATVTAPGFSQSVPVTYSGDCLNVTVVNGCAATATFVASGNHAGSTGSASVTVTQRPITVTAQPNTKVADGTTTAAAVPLVTAGSIASGDTGQFVETYDTAAVGTNKTLTPSGSVTRGATPVTGNYAINFVATTNGVITEPPAGYEFSGFFAPIDMSGAQTVWNTAKAGQAIPSKWRLLSGGVPVSDPTSFAGLFSSQVNCSSGSAIEDPIEEYAAGSSSLQYKGDGNWQFNWSTPASYKNTCRVMNIKLKDGTYSPVANFKFK